MQDAARTPTESKSLRYAMRLIIHIKPLTTLTRPRDTPRKLRTFHKELITLRYEPRRTSSQD
jgi:hypothetical protein